VAIGRKNAIPAGMAAVIENAVAGMERR